MLDTALFRMAWRIASSMAVAVILIAFTQRMGWVGWQEHFALAAEYYEEFRSFVLETLEWTFNGLFSLLSFNWTIDLPWWSGDALFLWMLFGQATCLHQVWVYNKGRPRGDRESIELRTLVFFSFVGLLFLPAIIFRVLLVQEYRILKLGDRLLFGVSSVFRMLRTISPIMLLLTAFFWIALAANIAL